MSGSRRTITSPLTRQIRLILLAAIALQSSDWPYRALASADTRTQASLERREGTARAEDRLSPSAFADPPVEARPGCFWAWLNGSITKEQITRDLEAMARGGMRGGEIWDVAAAADPDGRVPAGPAFLGPESTRLIAHAIREADRLGLKTGLVASSGWNAGEIGRAHV